MSRIKTIIQISNQNNNDHVPCRLYDLGLKIIITLKNNKINMGKKKNMPGKTSNPIYKVMKSQKNSTNKVNKAKSNQNNKKNLKKVSNLDK